MTPADENHFSLPGCAQRSCQLSGVIVAKAHIDLQVCCLRERLNGQTRAMASFRVFSSKNEIGFQVLGIDCKIQEVIFVCLGPLLAARRKAVAYVGVFGMTNDEDHS